MIIECNGIYRVKEGTSEKDPKKYKDRLVAKGFTQKEGVDFN